MRDKIVRKISKEQIIGVYQIINQINGKIYIGQSIDIERRWNQHRYGKGSLILRNAINKYGIDNFDFKIIEEVDPTNKSNKHISELLINLEQKWLNNTKPYLRENGYNIQSDAKPNIPIKRPDSYGELISKIKIENNHCGKGVKQYTKSGELVKEWKSSAEIERQLGYHAENISACCLRKTKTSNGFIWRFIDDEITEYDFESLDSRPKPITRKIIQLTLDGKKVKIWNSLKELVNNSVFDNRPVKQCCIGNRKEYKGYKWEFEV